jgi:hypothetical protein
VRESPCGEIPDQNPEAMPTLLPEPEGMILVLMILSTPNGVILTV